MKKSALKSIFSVFLAVTMLFTMTGFVSSAADTASLTVSSATGQANGNAVITVTAADMFRVNSLGFTLTYDANRFEVVTATSAYTASAGAAVDKSTAGRIVFTYANAVLPTTSVVNIDNTVVLTVNFKVKANAASGTSLISISGQSFIAYAADNSAEVKPLTVTSGQITVSGTAVTTGAALVVSSPSGVKGGNVAVSVEATGMTNVKALTFLFQYDSTRFSVVSASSAFATGTYGGVNYTTTPGVVSFRYDNTLSQTAAVNGTVLTVVLRVLSVPQSATSAVAVSAPSLTVYTGTGTTTRAVSITNGNIVIVTPDAEAAPSLTVNNPSGLIDGSISATVTAANMTRVKSLSFTLTYDASRFQLTSASSPYTGAFGTINTTVAGQITFTYSNSSAYSTAISGTILSATFKVLNVAQNGTSPLALINPLLTVYTSSAGTATEAKNVSVTSGEILVTNGTVVPVEGLDLSDKEIELGVGQSKKISVTIKPSNATNKKLAWTSFQPEVATVDQNGNITGVAVGTALVTVMASNGAVGAIVVTVKNIDIGIVLNYASYTLPQGAQFQLEATVYPTTATNKTVTWTSSDTTVASVSATGLVTTKDLPSGVTSKSAVITATSAAGYKAECVITVSSTATLLPEKVALVPEETIYLHVNDVFTLKAAVDPVGSTYSYLLWSSSDQSVVSVSTAAQTDMSAPITAKKVGTAYITVKTVVKELTARVKVVVLPAEKSAVTYSLNDTLITAVKDAQNNLEVELTEEMFKAAKVLYGDTFTAYMFKQTSVRYSSLSLSFSGAWIDSAAKYFEFGIEDIAKFRIDGALLTSLKAAANVTIKITRDYTFEIYYNGALQNIDNYLNPIKYTIFYGDLNQGSKPEQLVVYKNANGIQTIVPECNYRTESKTIEFWSATTGKFVPAFNIKNFPDVPSGLAYTAAVEYLGSRGIVEGIGSGDFAPAMNVKRADILIMIMRAYGITADASASTSFSDVPLNYYYAPYISAAKRMGLTNGVGNNNFAPDRNVTMQEMIVFVYRTLELLNKLPTKNEGFGMSSYKDATSVFDYAKTPVDAFIKAGVYTGVNGYINPTEVATREDVAVLLYNILSLGA